MSKVTPNDSWDEYGLKLAFTVAGKSKDPSTQCGCVILGPDHEVRTTGYNGLPRGVKYTEERITRPEKSYWMNHAEENAITNAARMGTALLGCTAYVTAEPCHVCSKSLINAGIKRIVFPEGHDLQEGERNDRWEPSLKRAREMCVEAGVVRDRIKL